MRKVLEKVATVALVCITLVFVLMAVLYATNVIPQKEIADNSVTVVVLSVLGVLYIGLSAYLLIINFSEGINIKRILLFYDTEGATRAGSKVIVNIVRGCVKEFPQLKLKKVALRVDDKLNLIANIKLEATVAEDIGNYVPQLKKLLGQSFLDALGLKFSVINIDVAKLNKKFTPTDTEVEEARQANDQTENAEEQAAATATPEEQEVVEQVLPSDTDGDHKQEDIAAGETTADA